MPFELVLGSVGQMPLTEACITLDWIDYMDLVGFFSNAGFG